MVDLRKAKPEKVICQPTMMNQIFENFVEFQDKTNEIHDLLCNDAGKKFIADIYDSFQFDKFGKIVRTPDDRAIKLRSSILNN